MRYLAEAVGRTEDGRGIRANGISAGPIKTLAASGIKDFGKLLGRVADAAPLRRNVTIDDVGNVAAFLLSDLASGVTAEITYVDGGFSQTAGLSGRPSLKTPHTLLPQALQVHWPAGPFCFFIRPIAVHPLYPGGNHERFAVNLRPPKQEWIASNNNQ